MIRKFFDTATGEPASQVQPSIAELMARHGTKNDNENFVSTPISIPEKKEEPPAPEATPAAMAEPASNAEPAKLESPSPEKVVETPALVHTEPQPTPQSSWQEVLKNQQPDTILKELGYDEKAVGFLKDLKEVDPKMLAFLQHWKSKDGNVTDYLRELTTDYDKMTAEDVMRHQLRVEYPKASPQQLDVLFKREVTKAYSLDSVDEEEVAEGRLLLESKADKFRESFKQTQQEYLLPKPPEPKAAEPDLSEQVAQQQFEAYKSQLTSNDFSKNIVANKSLSIGDGEEKFNYPVDPAELQDVLLNGEKWASTIFDIQDGANGKTFTPKVEHQYLVAAVAKYGYDFINKLADHFKTVGRKEAIAPIENATQPAAGSPSASEAAPNDPASAMARYGRLVG